MSFRLFRLVGCWLLPALASGCALVPEVRYRPVIHNPFPQLSRVAVVPFFNTSGDPTVDGQRFAEAYAHELQQVPGFEVVPVRVARQAIDQLQLDLGDPQQRRLLAHRLGVDAVVLGSVTEFRPHYPPRCGLAIRWYAADPCLHPIPAGYGLPWGTAQEEFIPDELVYEAEMELARAQVKAQHPPVAVPPAGPRFPGGAAEPIPPGRLEPPEHPLGGDAVHVSPWLAGSAAGTTAAIATIGFNPVGGTSVISRTTGGGDPADCPFGKRAGCLPSDEPVLSHTRLYVATDTDFTAALAAYYELRNDARFGGWQGYLQRSDDFIRFCCHKHIAEMLTARGGAGKSKVVYRWSPDR